MGMTATFNGFPQTVRAYVQSFPNPDFQPSPTLTLYAVFVMDSIQRVYIRETDAEKFREQENGVIERIKIPGKPGSLSPMMKIKKEIAFTTHTVILNQRSIDYFPTVLDASRAAVHYETFSYCAFLDDGSLKVYKAKFNPREWCWECTQLTRAAWIALGGGND